MTNTRGRVLFQTSSTIPLIPTSIIKNLDIPVNIDFNVGRHPTPNPIGSLYAKYFAATKRPTRCFILLTEKKSYGKQ